ncbi:secretion protein HlyD [Budviciaceae bacterium CWB-B4]|uniref:Secretion protein HlyD n=1 Tax=Limnobaculum xujianqingii TaxID=2738837 RepID=A0A9D7AFA3_9GAMM|nr:secretion protein HlyD [Limnobaculum xujianqingii]MBK5071677.1 secretion protein HlyD [Limnobaculum xujianqingii]MBK5174986.1 secretion protein HlyD [Limnobaculum xujianqingii]
MSKKKLLLIIVVILCAIAAFYSWNSYNNSRNSSLSLYGNVDIRTVNLNFRVGGRLTSLTVDEGDRVKPGQILGRLDDAPYINALQQAKANVESLKARLALVQEGYRTEEIAQVKAAVEQSQAAYQYAESFYQRQLGLWKTRSVSANTLDDSRNARDQAKATLQSAKDKLAQFETGSRPQEIAEAKANLSQAEAALAQAELNLSDTTLLSPSEGTILTRALEPGSMLSASNTVFSLSLTNPVWVRAYVNEVNLAKAVPGTELEIYTDARPDKPYHGTIGFVSPNAEFTPKSVETPELRTDLVYRLRIIVSDPDDNLRQGMPVTIAFPVR